jgi:hypothetical protein
MRFEYIDLPSLNPQLLAGVRWISCTLPTPESLRQRVRIREHLIWSAIRLRNRKGAVPTQKKLAQRVGIAPQHLKSPLDRLRANCLVELDQLRALPTGPRWCREAKGKPLTIKVPGPSPKCPVGLEALIVLAVGTSFPRQQTISSVSRLTGLDRRTVARCIKDLAAAGSPSAGWFQAKEGPQDPVRHRFNDWCRINTIERNQRKRLYQCLEYLGETNFYPIMERAKDRHDPAKGTSWVQLAWVMLKDRLVRVRALREQEETVAAYSRQVVHRERQQEELTRQQGSREREVFARPLSDQDDLIASLRAIDDCPRSTLPAIDWESVAGAGRVESKTGQEEDD